MSQLDKNLDFGILVMAANAASGGVLGSFNVYDAGLAIKLFDGDDSWHLIARFSVTKCSQVTLELKGDTTAATLATGGADTETIASTTVTVSEDGVALADDATPRYVYIDLVIPKQKAKMRYYGLWLTTTGTDDVVTDAGSDFTDATQAGYAYVTKNPQNHMNPRARAAVPA